MAIVPVVNKNYDIVLNGVGYRLVPNSLHVSRATPFTTRIATGKPTHSDLDQWDVVSYTGWTHGLGQEGGGETVADPLAFYDADGIETTIPGQFCLATRIVESDPNFIARKFCDSAKYVFAGGDTAIRHYDHLADVWANSVTGLGSMVTDLCRFQGSIYAALGDAGADMQRCADPDAAPTTWAALTGVKRQHLCTWKDKLWGTNGINLYSYDGTTWSDAIPIGGEGFAITALIPMGNLLVVGKTDRLFYYDGINVVETPLIVTDYRGNFSQGVVWQGYLYVPVLGTIQKIGGIGAAINVIDATPRWWGNDARINHGFGFPIACTFHPKAVFVLFHLAEGDRPVILKNNGVGWHAIYRGAVGAVAYGIYYSETADRLFFNDGSTRYQRYQTNGNPYPDYPTSGTHFIEFSIDSAGFDEIDKAWKSVSVVVDNVTATRYATIKYQINKDGAWHTCEDKVTVTPQQEIMFNPTQAAVAARFMQIRVELVTDDAQKTPRVKVVTVKRLLRPETMFVVTGQIIIADNLELLDGTREDKRTFNLISSLITASDAVTPITLDTPDGFRHKGSLTNLAWHEVMRREKN